MLTTLEQICGGTDRACTHILLAHSPCLPRKAIRRENRHSWRISPPKALHRRRRDAGLPQRWHPPMIALVDANTLGTPNTNTESKYRSVSRRFHESGSVCTTWSKFLFYDQTLPQAPRSHPCFPFCAQLRRPISLPSRATTVCCSSCWA